MTIRSDYPTSDNRSGVKVDDIATAEKLVLHDCINVFAQNNSDNGRDNHHSRNEVHKWGIGQTRALTARIVSRISGSNGPDGLETEAVNEPISELADSVVFSPRRELIEF